MIKLYNTLSGTIESLSPVDDVVKMYVCGVTPYAPSHVGHAMNAVVFDVLRRYLEFSGYRVKHVENITDIDDKVITGAKELGISTQELADRNAQVYMEELAVLNVLRAHFYPRATQEIPRIKELIQTLLEKGYAYVVDGDVYFRVREDKEYGKLSHRSLDNMRAGARVEVDESKEDPMDFALWKSQKPGEPAWDSPWGAGRPGWHIECSAMSQRYLGLPLDIHGGGQDLVFPHHENEIAQSEACADGVSLARFWVHNGLLRLGDDKMSKSLGNFVTISEALQRFSPDALRLFYLSSHYRSPLTYSDEGVAAQERAAERLRRALGSNAADKEAERLPLDSGPYRERYTGAMDDDLNTPRAIAALFDLAREINRAHEEGRDACDAQDTLRELAGVLGLTLEPPEIADSDDVSPLVSLLIETRSELRAAKQYDLADRIRQRLLDIGYAIEDTPQGTIWRRSVRGTP